MKSSHRSTESATRQGILVFSDLDGTLLDDTYRWDAAEPSLEQLRTLGFPLILSSSKTLDEMITLASALDTRAPLISENGAIVAVPKTERFSTTQFGTIRGEPYQLEFTGLSRPQILAEAHRLRELEGYCFSGFHDWTLDDIIAATGLSRAQAEQAANRLATEPILWEEDDARWPVFESALNRAGIGTVKGGRFIHLMGSTDKAMGLKRIVELYKELEPETEWHVVALGDSPNDLAMLSAADTAVVIPNPRHPAGLEPTATRVLRAEASGPLGWNTCMEQILVPYINPV